jgi:hypothetical protein
MTPRFDAYMLSMANRDQALMQLALIALVLVAAWRFVGLAPVQVQPVMRRVYLVGGGVLYVVTLLFTVGGLHV